jgi:hypothetical protein
MDEGNTDGERAGITERALDIGVALAFIAIAAVAMWDSVRLGIHWGADGPRSGYFPFYIGLIMMAAAAIVLVQSIFAHGPRKVVIEIKALRSVGALLVPTIAYVAAIGLIGIYVSSMLYLAYFMRVLGKYRWGPVMLISLAIPLALFVLFEIWFLVALPKGPIEDWLGY